jgi:hypothetical protein
MTITISKQATKHTPTALDSAQPCATCKCIKSLIPAVYIMILCTNNQAIEFVSYILLSDGGNSYQSFFFPDRLEAKA